MPTDRQSVTTWWSTALGAALTIAWIDLLAAIGSGPRITREIVQLTGPFALAIIVCTILLLVVGLIVIVVRGKGASPGALIVVPMWSVLAFFVTTAADVRATWAYPDYLLSVISVPKAMFWMTTAVVVGGLSIAAFSRCCGKVIKQSTATAAAIVIPSSIGLLTIWLWGVRLPWPTTFGRASITAALLISVALVIVVTRRADNSGWAGRLVIGQWCITVAAALSIGLLFTDKPAPSRAEGMIPSVPTVILLTADTLRADATGSATGNSLTPAVDRLAEDSVVYTGATAPASWTLPSLASLMSGLAPEVHHANTWANPLPLNVTTLGERLHGAGYHTAVIGRSPFLTPEYGLTQGFTKHQTFPVTRPTRTFGTTLEERLSWPSDATTDKLAELAVEWLQTHQGQPVFLWLHLYDPHQPYAPPSDFHPAMSPPPGMDLQFNKMDNLRRGHLTLNPGQRSWLRELYNGEVRLIDRAVGRVVDSLRRLGRYDDALVVFASDHGEEFWEHGGVEHGHSLYQELINVPLLIKPPTNRPAPRTVSSTVSLTSVLPTVLELCGVPFDADELSAPSLAGGDPQTAVATVSSGSLYFEHRRSVILGRFKYIHNLDSDTEELYDLELDPEEQNSIHQDQTEVLERARLALVRWDVEASALARSLGIEPGGDLELDGATRKRLEALGYAVE